MKWLKYNQGLWSEEMALNAVDKGILTPGQANEILGQEG